MINKFQDKAQRLIALSESVAFELGQSSVGTEHLLLAYLKTKENKLKTLLEKEGITYESMKEEIICLFGKKANKPFYMEYTNSLKKVLEYAVVFSKKKLGRRKCDDILKILAELAELDYKIKTGQIDRFQGFELFIVSDH